MLPTYSVSLNADGTISGAFSGTWSATPNTYFCTMIIGGVTYKGIFFKQYDESASHKNTMTFSLIGNNNQAIWGSKTSDAPGSTTLDGDYFIKSVHSGLYLDIPNGSSENGVTLQQWSYNGSQAQRFRLVSDGNGYYSILTGASGYSSCIDVENSSTENGANIIQWEYWGGDCQKFQIVEVSSGVYAIKTKVTSNNSCLDVYDWSTQPGGRIAQWEYWGGNCQLWYLEPAN